MNRHYKRGAVQTHSIRFCRWSRKGYAALLSRLYSVSIGHLAKNIIDRLALKEKEKDVCFDNSLLIKDLKSEERIFELLEEIGLFPKLTHITLASANVDDYKTYNLYNYYKGSRACLHTTLSF